MKLKELIEINKKEGYHKWQLITMTYTNNDKKLLRDPIYHDDFILFNSHDIDKVAKKDYIVLIPYYSNMDIGRCWKNWNVNTIVVTTYEELRKKYSVEQLNTWLIWLDAEIRKEIKEHANK